MKAEKYNTRYGKTTRVRMTGIRCTMSVDDARELSHALQRAAADADAENRTKPRCALLNCNRYAGHDGEHTRGKP